MQTGLGSQHYLKLFESLTSLIGSHDPEEICVRSCDLIAGLLEVEACSLMLADGANQRLRLAAATHIPEGDWAQVEASAEEGLIGRVLGGKEALLIESAEEFRSCFGREPDPRYATPSCVIAPFHVKDEMAGVVSVAHPTQQCLFRPRDVELLVAAANMVGGALTNALRYRDTLKIYQYLEQVFDSLHIAILSVDAQGRVLHMNHRAQTLFRVEVTSEARPRLSSILPLRVHEDCLNLISQSEGHVEPLQKQISLKLNDVPATFALTVTPMRCLGGASADHLILFDGINQEEEVQRLREVERVKASFLSIISHELRTPLSIIRGSLPMIDPSLGKPVKEEVLGQVHRLLSRNAQRLTDVVNSILDVTEIENGTMKLALRPLDIGEMLRELVALHEETAAAKEVRMDVDLAESAPPIEADRRRLRQVFSEMIYNAVKFSHPRQPISIRTRANGTWFEIDMTNDGARIEPEQRRTIFEKFHQCDASTIRAAGGCGLGLFLAKHIIERHRGQIELLDTQGTLTTFRIRLPMSDATRVEEHASTAIEAGR